MLDLSAFQVAESKVYKVLKYFGENHYYIFAYPDKDSYYLCVAKLDSRMEEFDIKQDDYVCSSLSSAIAIIEALEKGEEV